MTQRALFTSLAMVTLLGCHGSVLDSRDQVLPGGGQIRVLCISLSHTIGDPESNDSMVLNYVANNYSAPAESQLAEAWKVFPLIKSTCELWGLNNAKLQCHQSKFMKGDFRIFHFSRKPDGSWICIEGRGHVLAQSEPTNTLDGNQRPGSRLTNLDGDSRSPLSIGSIVGPALLLK